MISIIIPACNEEKYLAETINAIKEQEYKEYEIIVVCDGCTDATEKIARKFTKKVVLLKQRGGPAHAKNKGVDVAEGKDLVFLDADTKVTGKTLEEIAKVFKKDKTVIGTCKIQPSNKKLKHRFFMGVKNKLICPLGVSNGIIFCSKETFHDFKGFNPKLKKGEDGDFVRRIKKQRRFIILQTPVISSTRRFENKGYLRIGVYWIKEYLKPSNKDYELIR